MLFTDPVVFSILGADKLCDRFPDAGKDVVAAALHKHSGHAGKISTRILGKTMRDVVINKERWKRRRTATQDPSSAATQVVAPRVPPGYRFGTWHRC